MKRFKYIFLFVFVLCVTIGHAQAPTQIKKKCPNISIYSIVSITAVGDILYNPCPSRSSIFTRTVDFTNATVIGLPFSTSPLTTKGDLWGFSTLNTRVPIGVNGQVLTADSTVPLGLKWAAAGGGGTVTGTGTTNFFTRWTNGAGGVLGDTPNSWNNTLYTWNNTALNAQFTMALTPSVAGGLFRVGDFTTTPTDYLEIDQTADTSRLFGNAIGLFTTGGTTFLQLDAGSGAAQLIGGTTSIVQSPNVTLGNITSNININSATRNIKLDSKVGATTIGDLLAGSTGIKLTVDDVSSAFTFGNTANTGLVNFSGVNNVRFRNATSITPTTAAAGNNIGTTLLPFSSLFIGAAATNNIQLIGTATAARVITLPDATGTVALVGGSGTISGLTANTIPKAASATTLSNSRITDNGTDINIDSGAGVTTIGDVTGSSSGTTLTVDDSNGIIVNGVLLPLIAAGSGVGTLSFPFNSYILGSAANQTTSLGSLATANRNVNFPDATGTVQLVGAANTGTIMSVPLNNTTLTTATTAYVSPCSFLSLANVTEASVSCPMTRAGTIRNLYVRTGGAAKTNTPTTTITMRKNGSNQTVTLVMTETVNTTTSDTTHSFTVAADDLITISLSVAGAAAVSTSIAGITFEID